MDLLLKSFNFDDVCMAITNLSPVFTINFLVPALECVFGSFQRLLRITFCLSSTSIDFRALTTKPSIPIRLSSTFWTSMVGWQASSVCSVTPKGHLGTPSVLDARDCRFIAHATDLSSLLLGIRDPDDEFSRSRLFVTTKDTLAFFWSWLALWSAATKACNRYSYTNRVQLHVWFHALADTECDCRWRF